MSTSKNEPVKKTMLEHRILREIYRHYTELGAWVAANGCDKLIEHSYPMFDEEGNEVGKKDITISFWDLHGSLKKLSERKREAVYLNVILDWKQKDVAEKMGITTVSVGQYVEQAMQQLAKTYFEESESEDATKGAEV